MIKTVWKYVSDNWENISLHDYDISEFVFGRDITLGFVDGFDVCKENPQNLSGRHKHTGNAAVILKNGAFLSAEYPSFEDNGKEIPAQSIEFSELSGLELEVFDHYFENGIFTLECTAWNSKGSFCKVNFTCEKPLFCWNEFTEDAWFWE